MKTIVLFAVLCLSLMNVSGKEISFSFDDAPREGTFYFNANTRTNHLLRELKKSGVTRAAFYVNTKNIYRDGALKRIKSYQSNGHLIGNHTHSHINIHTNTVKDYLDDFNLADKILRENGFSDLYFRYPFLWRGKNINEIKTVHSHIKNTGYVDAFVTVDSYDFYMDKLFQDALSKGHKINMENLKKFYVETLYKGIMFYDDLAVKSLGRSVKHVMLLHENDLAALFVGDLISLLRSKGWKIITPEESYTDPLTSYFPVNVFNHGAGRIVSLAADNGYQGPTKSGLEDYKVLDDLFLKYKVVK